MPLFIFLLSLLVLSSSAIADSAPFQGNGIKIGEVTSEQALVWMRLTRMPTPRAEGSRFLRPKKGKGAPPTEAQQLPAGLSLSQMCGAHPGTTGEIRIHWRATQKKATAPPEKEVAPPSQHTAWIPVDPAKDHTCQYRLTALEPDTRYTLTIESRSLTGDAGETLTGTFQTAPASDSPTPITFAVATCQSYEHRDSPEGHQIYPVILKKEPRFFIHTGDLEYYDKPSPLATSPSLARFKWNRLYGLPHLVHFHKNMPSYFLKDDHDTTKDDAWPGVAYGELTWQDGLDLFQEQFPVKNPNYRTVRWGKDLQIWMVEGRDFRSPNPTPDGPEKTIWGKEQKNWFFKTFRESDATFRLLISPTPLVGPDRDNKNDNHANAGFSHEGAKIRRFLADQKNAYVISGDRHWQYISLDQETGLKEFSCGPTSMAHVGGWKQKDQRPSHQYLNVTGGFLTITVHRPEDGRPTLSARYYNPTGDLLYEDHNPSL